MRILLEETRSRETTHSQCQVRSMDRSDQIKRDGGRISIAFHYIYGTSEKTILKERTHSANLMGRKLTTAELDDS